MSFKKKYARDDNPDGILEVHCNSCEGLWTELRNFLRPFKGVHKKYLAQYVAQFENAFNFKEHFEDIIAHPRFRMSLNIYSLIMYLVLPLSLNKLVQKTNSTLTLFLKTETKLFFTISTSSFHLE